MQTLTTTQNNTESLCEFCLIPLTKGLFAIVDKEDYEKLAAYKWHASESRNNFYAQRSCKGKTIKMHREIINVPEGFVCDHINHNTLDNRKCNLRICTARQNALNQKPSDKGTSIYKGVSWHKGHKKWQAKIDYHKHWIHIGYFDYELDAAVSYDDMAIELFGQFACLNFHYRPQVAKWMAETYLI